VAKVWAGICRAWFLAFLKTRNWQGGMQSSIHPGQLQASARHCSQQNLPTARRRNNVCVDILPVNEQKRRHLHVRSN